MKKKNNYEDWNENWYQEKVKFNDFIEILDLDDGEDKVILNKSMYGRSLERLVESYLIEDINRDSVGVIVKCEKGKIIIERKED